MYTPMYARMPGRMHVCTRCTYVRTYVRTYARTDARPSKCTDGVAHTDAYIQVSPSFKDHASDEFVQKWMKKLRHASQSTHNVRQKDADEMTADLEGLGSKSEEKRTGLLGRPVVSNG